MLPPQRPVFNGIVATFEEHHAILRERLAVLAAATGEGRLGGPLPVPWRTGWKCHFIVLERDLEGALRVEFRAWHSQSPRRRYVRSRRFVQRKPLPYERGQELREE